MPMTTGKRSRIAITVLSLGLFAAGCGATPDSGNQSPGSDPGQAAIESLIPAALFEQLFLHRSTAPCQGAFYTYRAFLDATLAFPSFAQQGSTDDRKRELAAFFANVAHETTGGWASAPDGPYAWGLCWINEGATVDASQLPDYCAASTQYPCQPGKKYFGRGPIQLSYNYNYGLAGTAVGADLLHAPELVATDPLVSWKTALWFWMTAQAPKPSCHDVITGQWTPSTADLTAGRQPGFGMTVNIINGGVECNQPTPAQVADRVGFYGRFTQVLGTAAGPNQTCDKMQSY